MDFSPIAVFSFIVLVFSVVIHEVAHGYAALVQGDKTAQMLGRLTLNPLKHIDPIGSIVVPIITTLAGISFGWAKPVPFNMAFVRNKRWGEALIAAAGPASNLAIAFVLSVVVRLIVVFDIGGMESTPILQLFIVAIIVNISLAVFNLIPIPPLDGSKILSAFLPARLYGMRRVMERYWIVLFLFILFFGWAFISPLIRGLLTLFVGI
jgi:Zn-dependent protease